MDGYITIGTKVDTSGIETGLNSIKGSVDKNMSGLQSTVGKTFNLIKGSIIGAGIILALRQITKEVGNAIDRLDTMKNYTNVMSNLGINSEDAEASIKRLSEGLDGLPTTLNDAAQSVQKFTSVNNNVKASTEMFLAVNNAILAGGASAQQQAAAMYQLSDAYAKGKPDMIDWRSMMTAMPAQLNQVAQVMGYGANGANQLGEALRNGDVSMNEFMITMTKMNREGLNGFKSFDEQARNSTGGIATSIANMRTAITRGLADILDAIGRSNIASFFDAIRNAINAVIPYIVAFIKLIKTAISYIGGLFGMKTKKTINDTKNSISGASTSMGNLGSSAGDASGNMNKATGSAKKLNKELKQMAAFDEMNVLQENTSAGSGGSGGGTGGAGGGAGDLSGIDLSGFDDLEDKTSKADEIFAKMMDKIKKFQELLNKLNFGNIIKHIQSIGKTLAEIFTNPEVVNAATNWAKTFINTLKTVIVSVVQIGLNIAEGLLGSIDLYLQQNKDRIINYIVQMFNISSHINEITGEFSKALAEISKVFTSDAFKQIGADIIKIFADAFMSATLLAMKFIDDLTTLLFQPIIDNSTKIKTTIENALKAVQPIFDTLSKAVEYIGDKWNEVYDQHIHPFFKSLTEGVSDTLGKFLDVYNEYIVPFMSNISKDIEKLWNEHLKPFVDAVGGLIGSIIDFIKLLWERWLKPLIDWIIQNIIPIIVPILSQIWNAVKTVFSIIVDIITHFINVIKGIIDFIVGVFTGDWKKAWDAVKGIFESLWNTIVKIVKTVIDYIFSTIKNGLDLVKNTVKAIINKIVDNFKNAFNNIKNVVKTVMDAIKSIMKAGWDGVWNTIKGIINKIISGVEQMCNALIDGINKVFKPLADVGNKVLDAVGIKGFKFTALHKVSLPRLAKGGIINMPGKGVPVGGAIAGEKGQEGVIPLTDTQQMALLGEAIGKYITINANITNTMNGRVISRELQKIQNESDFAYNR